MKTYIAESISDIKNTIKHFTDELCDGLNDMDMVLNKAINGDELIAWIEERVDEELLRKDIIEKIREMQRYDLG